MRICQALLSVSDKRGAVDFARALHELGVRLLSTGGTAQLLRDSGLPVVEAGEYTGFPEMLGGRVKTLHPKIHGGILARRDDPSHLAQIEAAGIPRIDMVAVNLYPFARSVGKPGCALDEALENIDIGGPAMVRAAAKNYRGVAVVTDPADYGWIVEALRAHRGELAEGIRFELARKAFAHTARYDGEIANYLTSLEPGGARTLFPARLQLAFDKVQALRYGENPHQEAAFYREPQAPPGAISSCRQLQGKELSYNNIADADAAWECVKALEAPACVIVKHANPCGAALGGGAIEAYHRAFATDPTSAFGGIVAFNRELDRAAAEAVSRQFLEVLIAPGFTDDARGVLAGKQNVRVLEAPLGEAASGFDFKRVGGGLLVQRFDTARVTATQLKIVTARVPTSGEIADLLFAWCLVKFVKSNAIVYCQGGQTIGIGAGQMSRVDAARIAALKAEQAGLSVAGSVVASDAFFPFRDGIDVLAHGGATAVIQPGGSVRDAEVIAAADEHGLAMAFTGIRHFRH